MADSRAGGTASAVKVRPRKRSLRYRLRWRIASVLYRSRRVCGTTVGCWAEYGGEIRERNWSADWCRENDLVNGACYCNKINAKEGRT